MCLFLKNYNFFLKYFNFIFKIPDKVPPLNFVYLFVWWFFFFDTTGSSYIIYTLMTGKTNWCFWYDIIFFKAEIARVTILFYYFLLIYIFFLFTILLFFNTFNENSPEHEIKRCHQMKETIILQVATWLNEWFKLDLIYDSKLVFVVKQQLISTLVLYDHSLSYWYALDLHTKDWLREW